MKTPVFQARDQREEMQKINVDTTKVIKKIAVAIQDRRIVGLRLVDSRGIYIVNKLWTSSDQYSKWIIKPIPHD